MKEGKGRETNTVSGKEGISDLKIIESRRKEKGKREGIKMGIMKKRQRIGRRYALLMF